MRLPWISGCLFLVVVGCDGQPTVNTPAVPRSPAAASASSERRAAAAPQGVENKQALPCESPALHFENGAPQGLLCPEQARKRGLTIVDLSDSWAPTVFQAGPLYVPPAPVDTTEGAETLPDGTLAAAPAAANATPGASQASGITGESLAAPSERVTTAPGPTEPVMDTPDYHKTYVALANEQFAKAGADAEMAAEDRYLELYGVFPSLSILHKRFASDERYACHDAIDDSSLPALSGVMWEEKGAAAQLRQRQAQWLRASLERQRTARKLETLDDLARVNKQLRLSVARLTRLETTLAAITATEAHLVCDGLLHKKRLDGVFDWHTGEAIGLFQRRNFVVANGQLDEPTRTALATDSRELDFRDALRVLRERVINATGILADGSAQNRPLPILGHMIDPPSMHVVPGHQPLQNGAPDIVNPTTEAAARHLGWTDIEGVRGFLAQYAEHARKSFLVAVKLPDVPDYYTKHMDLRVVIDRGDVWYDARPGHRKVARRPAFILMAKVDGKDLALVRWGTTIGGWEKERLQNGAVVDRFKESDVGPRIWRDMYAAPAWFPPPNTPDDDLVRRSWNGRYSLKQDSFGPGYRSAYGLAMFIHHAVVPVRGGVRLDDNQIRTHGSASYQSIVRGTSHGCHRLFNHHALRLASFVIQHRQHNRHGEEVRNYERVVRKGGHRVIRLRSRGYRYELTPPMEVVVTEGRIKSPRKAPPLWAR